jgi:hypothetical protein
MKLPAIPATTAAATAATASAASTTTASATTTTAAAESAATTTTTAAAESTATASAASTTEGTFFFRTGFVHNETSSTHLASIDSIDCLLGVFFRRHFNESKSFGLTGEFVRNDSHRIDRAVWLEQLFKLIFGDAVGQAPYVELLVHTILLMLVFSVSRLFPEAGLKGTTTMAGFQFNTLQGERLTRKGGIVQ